MAEKLLEYKGMIALVLIAVTAALLIFGFVDKMIFSGIATVVGGSFLALKHNESLDKDSD